MGYNQLDFQLVLRGGRNGSFKTRKAEVRSRRHQSFLSDPGSSRHDGSGPTGVQAQWRKSCFFRPDRLGQLGTRALSQRGARLVFFQNWSGASY
jgi:hypothetical protein